MKKDEAYRARMIERKEKRKQHEEKIARDKAERIRRRDNPTPEEKYEAVKTRETLMAVLAVAGVTPTPFKDFTKDYK